MIGPNGLGFLLQEGKLKGAGWGFKPQSHTAYAKEGSWERQGDPIKVGSPCVRGGSLLGILLEGTPFRGCPLRGLPNGRTPLA